MIIEVTREQAADSGYVECLVDGAHGIYVPQRFAETCNPRLWGIRGDDIDILQAGPDHEHYWDVWDEVLQDAMWQEGEGPNKCKFWRLEQDGDLFAVCVQHGQNDVEIVD